MNKYHWMLHSLIVSAIALSGLPKLSHQDAIAKTTPRGNSFSWGTIFHVLFDNKPPVKPRKGGSRPSNPICMVSPDAPYLRETPKSTTNEDKVRIVWSDRPLFLWQDSVDKIALRSEVNDTNLWTVPVAGTQKNTYTGQPLQPGKTYKWVANSNIFVTFKVMEAEQRQRITSELRNLENQLQVKRANKEETSLAKSKYFIKQELWADALQQAYSVEKPSKELAQIIKDIPN